MSDKSFQRLVLIVQIATVFLFLGRGWQHVFWDAPFRSILWDEQWMSSFVSNVFQLSWEDYITSPDIDYKIQSFIKGVGWFYFLCALMAVFAQKWKRISGVFMILGSISLIFLAALYCKEKFFSIGQFFEYSIQFSTPLLLYFIIKQGTIKVNLLWFLKVIIALTFACHGLYAINYYPRPGMFVDMTLEILKISESNAQLFLNTAGIMDFVIAIGVFLPFRYSKWVLIYAIFWGFMTTFARVCANIYFDFFWESIHQWWYEAAYRVSHFLIPLALYLFLKEQSNSQRKESS